MLRKVDRLDRSRAEGLYPEVVEEYFKLLKNTLEENGLVNSPCPLIIVMRPSSS